MKGIYNKMQRKRMFIGILIIIVMLLVFALVINFSSNRNMKSNENNEMELKAILMDEGTGIELDIYNNSEETVSCGLEYEIQIYKGNAWKKCSDEIVFNDIGIEILPNGLYVQNIVLRNNYFDGSRMYRIKKVINGYEYYSNEFVIE